MGRAKILTPLQDLVRLRQEKKYLSNWESNLQNSESERDFSI